MSKKAVTLRFTKERQDRATAVAKHFKHAKLTTMIQVLADEAIDEAFEALKVEEDK